MRLVYYSLANFSYDSREHQWIQSIRSLRLRNPSIPVWLVLFHSTSAELLREAERWGVHVQLLGDYEKFLQLAHARGSILAWYPTFHKFMVLSGLPLEDASQVLYLDCDTFFFDDVDILFDRYAEHDLYAREEFKCRRSPLGYDPNHIDEDVLESIVRDEGLRFVPPFNSGVCLFNRGFWRRLEDLGAENLDLAWRLLCGREIAGREDKKYDPRLRQAVRDAMTDRDRSRALPYPSANDWIIEQIALWLALGRLENFSLGTLSADHVPQGGEFETMLGSAQRCVLAHYFGSGQKRFFASVQPIAA